MFKNILRYRVMMLNYKKFHPSKRRYLRRSGAFIVNFKHIWHLFLEFLLFTLSNYLFAAIRAL